MPPQQNNPPQTNPTSPVAPAAPAPTTPVTPAAPAVAPAAPVESASQRSPQPSRQHRPWWLVGLLIVWLVLLGWVVMQRQALYDWWKLRNYHAPQAVVKLADEDTMKPYTRHLFYLNKPQLLPTVSSFRKACPENPDTIVLGCYHPGQNGIFIYNVSDPSLAGVQQVTAAHEVLHAVYARLSGSARKTLNSELEDYYQHGLTDERVKAEVKLYQKTEPHSVYDEMSCTFGTEIAQLPAGLERYYEQYFSNRQAIVAYEQQYEREFTTRLNTLNTDDQQLTSLKSRIDSEQTSLEKQLATINSTRTHLNQLLAKGQTASYNAGVDAFNAQVTSYNTGVATLKRDITAYNELVTTRNKVASQLTTLDQALDTRLTVEQTR
ncbi:MAG TPA: hypothetical protein VG992_01745 [Candidatus Saccharimonadales bacterium]|nr:hypothetical protein [Candidatus Saccharimonadales bacterium]